MAWQMLGYIKDTLLFILCTLSETQSSPWPWWCTNYLWSSMSLSIFFAYLEGELIYNVMAKSRRRQKTKSAETFFTMSTQWRWYVSLSLSEAVLPWQMGNFRLESIFDKTYTHDGTKKEFSSCSGYWNFRRTLEESSFHGSLHSFFLNKKNIKALLYCAATLFSNPFWKKMHPFYIVLTSKWKLFKAPTVQHFIPCQYNHSWDSENLFFQSCLIPLFFSFLLTVVVMGIHCLSRVSIFTRSVSSKEIYCSFR